MLSISRHVAGGFTADSNHMHAEYIISLYTLKHLFTAPIIQLWFGHLYQLGRMILASDVVTMGSYDVMTRLSPPCQL